MQFSKIILASKSPRRKQLLTEAGFDVCVRVNSVDESYPLDLPVEEVAEYVALKKNAANQAFLEPNTILLTCDTAVIHQGTHFEKPLNFDEARAMLEALSGDMHEVISGVCLQSEHKKISFSVCSKVYLDALTSEEIDFYINHGQPYDKAGGYGIQEWIGLCKIASIEGSYTNIVGLPMREVYQGIVEMKRGEPENK